MKTLLANMQHAVRTGQAVTIGGGIFTPEEIRDARATIIEMQELLTSMAFTVETVAHLRGMELELLPVADKARALLAKLEN